MQRILDGELVQSLLEGELLQQQHTRDSVCDAGDREIADNSRCTIGQVHRLAELRTVGVVAVRRQQAPQLQAQQQIVEMENRIRPVPQIVLVAPITVD